MKCISRVKKEFMKIGYALNGFKVSLEHNLFIYLLIFYLIINITFSIIFSYSIERILIIVIIDIITILMNIIEKIVKNVVDLCIYDIHPLAKEAKDLGKWLVLLSFIGSIITNVLLVIF